MGSWLKWPTDKYILVKPGHAPGCGTDQMSLITSQWKYNDFTEEQWKVIDQKGDPPVDRSSAGGAEWWSNVPDHPAQPTDHPAQPPDHPAQPTVPDPLLAHPPKVYHQQAPDVHQAAAHPDGFHVWISHYLTKFREPHK